MSDHGQVKAAVKAFWEEEACGERYGDDQDALRYALEPEILAFADFPAGAGRRVLEIGVGLGADLSRWAAAGAGTVGVDLTERALWLAKGRLGERGLGAGLAQADAERLPFRDRSFDIVYSWGVLHHTPSTAGAIREALRVLEPGGTLKVMLYHRRSWFAAAAWGRFSLLRGRPWRGLRAAVAQVESPGTQAFTRAEVTEMLAGAEAVEIRTVLTHWDRRVTAGLARRIGGNRLGWFLLATARKPPA